MKVPISWLKEYIDINVDLKKFSDSMTLSGSKVEGIDEPYAEITKVVTGKIIELAKHPDADKLQISKVDVGTDTLQIVTGAPNVSVGDVIPLALEGATLPGGKKITKGKLRGVESYGMMCSIQELNLTKENFPEAPENGVFILPPNTEIGRDIKEVLGLNECVIEFEITPNRPDCLSIIGLAREAAATFRKKFNQPLIKKTGVGNNAGTYATVNVLDNTLCNRYTARVVENVKIGTSPKWMRDRLSAAGIRPINNIVDITNYVLLEYGQPMHAFDLDKLAGSKINVRKAIQGEKIVTLDEQERLLDSETLIIADASEPIAIAGIMGGLYSRVTENTKNILFESANFSGTAVRITSKKLGLRSESSSRFEKGLDPENVISAIDRACELVEILKIGEVRTGVIDEGYKSVPRKMIPFRPEKINTFLGTNISMDQMVGYLTCLGFEMNWENKTVIVPYFRRDVEIEADLSEEIARFHDYNNIESTLLSGKTSMQGKKTNKQKNEDKIKNIMLSQGFYETCTYSFESPKVFEQLQLPSEHLFRKSVVITNPLGEDFSVMRTSTVPSILRVLATNNNRRVEDVSVFEMSNIYRSTENSNDGLPKEILTLTLGMYGKVDFYNIKGAVEELLSQLGIKNYEIIPEKESPYFHPGRTGKILIENKEIGLFGQIHPNVAENFECAKETFVGTLEVAALIENTCIIPKLVPLPKFPAMQRDIAVLVKEEITVKEIEDIIKQRSGKILEEVKLFDIYRGKQVECGQKSVAYSITFRDSERTLTDEEVNKAMEKVVNELKEKLNAQLRQ